MADAKSGAVEHVRPPARNAEERGSGPDRLARCSFCDQGVLPGEVWDKPRECCERGHSSDVSFMAAEAKRP